MIKNKINLLTCLSILLIGIIFPLVLTYPVSADDPLSLTTTQPPAATENENYSWTIAIHGGLAPYSCNITGSLPPGLSFDSDTLTISGKPNTGLAASTYAFDIAITDSSDPAQNINIPSVINVQYKSNVSATAALSTGEASIFADGRPVTGLSGSKQIVLLFPSGTVHTIAVSNPVTIAGNDNVRFVPLSEKKVVNGKSPDVYFDFTPEYSIRIVTNDPNIPSAHGSGWYKINDSLNSSAPEQLEMNNGTQYRFTHWQLPEGEVYGKPELNWKVTSGGDITAVYDTYYYLTVNSEYCDAQGSDWYKAGSKARWSIECTQSIPVPGFWGMLGIEMKPEKSSGSVIMNASAEVNVSWHADYSRIIIPVVTGVVVALILAVFRLIHGRAQNVITKYKR